LGLDDIIGSIEPGKQADIIILDTNKPHLTPLYHPVSHIVYAASGSDVKEVIIAGKRIVQDYRLLTVDVEDIVKKANILGNTVMRKDISIGTV